MRMKEKSAAAESRFAQLRRRLQQLLHPRLAPASGMERSCAVGAGGQLAGYAGKSKVNFGGLMTPRDRFATWDMVRELSRSPLVEIGSHTRASHYGIPANPQGSREPAIANRFFDNATGHYRNR